MFSPRSFRSYAATDSDRLPTLICFPRQIYLTARVNDHGCECGAIGMMGVEMLQQTKQNCYKNKPREQRKCLSKQQFVQAGGDVGTCDEQTNSKMKSQRRAQ